MILGFNRQIFFNNHEQQFGKIMPTKYSHIKKVFPHFHLS